MKPFAKLSAFESQCEIWRKVTLERKTAFGRSVLRCREARASFRGISQLNGLFLCPSRIGSVNCGQRHANATTRKTRNAVVTVRNGRCSRPAPRKQAASYQSAMKGDAWEGVKRIAWLQGTGQTRTAVTRRESVRFHQGTVTNPVPVQTPS